MFFKIPPGYWPTSSALTFAGAFLLALTLIISCGASEQTEQSEQIDQPVQTDQASFSAGNEEGFEPLFNGRDLTGWDGDDRFWSVQDGVIVGETSPDNLSEANTFLIWEGGEPGNFETRFDYRFVIVGDENYGNSGFQIRSEQFTDSDNPDLIYRMRGYQADFAISDWIPGIHYEEGKREILARRGERVLIDNNGERHPERFAEEAELGSHITHTEWNSYRVEAIGDTIRSSINGQLMHELIDQSPQSSQSGLIAFQLHSGPPMRVEIRNARLKMLD